MQDFTIDIIEKNYLQDTNSYIRMTTFKDNQSNGFGSFDEKLTIKENSAASLTFFMYKEVEGRTNPFIDYLVNDRLLRLVRGNEVYHFVITNVQPSITSNNVKYSYTCQDEFSYSLSRRNLGLSFKTDDSEDYEDYEYAGIWGTEDNCGPKTLVELIDKLFEICNITDWQLDKLKMKLYNEFLDNLYESSQEMKVTVELNNSNPFNALVQFANLFNAIIQIDYSVLPHKIVFRNKNLMKYEGFDLRPEYNIQNFSYSEKGDSLYNIMTVTGGEDSEGNYISIVPTMPASLRNWIVKNYDTITDLTNVEILQKIQKEYFADKETINYFKTLERIPHASSFLYDFSYWYEHNLISQEEKEDIDHDICINLRNINFQINAFTPVYLKEKSNFEKLVKNEEEIVALMAAEEESLANLTNDDASKVMHFYSPTEIITINGVSKKVMRLGIINPTTTAKTYNFEYGLYRNSSFVDYLPQWDTFVSLSEQNNYKYYLGYYSDDKLTWKEIELVKDPTLDSTCLTITEIIPSGYNATLYCDYDDTIMKIPVENIDLENITQNSINNYESQLLKDIWTYDYIYYYRDLYGKNYIQTKINDLKKKIQEKSNLRNSYIQKILTAVAPLNLPYTTTTNEERWAEIRHNFNLTISQSDNYNCYIEYADYKEKLIDLETYLGGPGTRIKVEGSNSADTEYYSFKGYYQWYLDELNNLMSIESTFEEQLKNIDGNLYNKLYGTNGLIIQQNNWWANFRKKHKHCLRETTYSDTNQLTSNGLYSAAIKQFETYKQPNQSYSASYINSNYIIDYHSAKIGDIIQVHQPQIFNEVKDHVFMIQVLELKNKGLNMKEPCFIGNSNGEIQLEVLDICNDGYYKIIYCYYPANNIYTKTFLSQKGINYPIYSISPYKKSAPVKLQISGITKDLRSTTEQLTVSKQNTINAIVDKLLYNINN